MYRVILKVEGLFVMQAVSTTISAHIVTGNIEKVIQGPSS